MVKPLGPQEIRLILAVTDALELHRENVRIPLAPRGAGSLRVTETGQLEIVVPESENFDTWVKSLPQRLRALDLSRVRRAG
jgi:hypothetical protein